mmetsp:Transcript_4415/g.5944  ORF Transcript_4415/g.5944 Transcript_4415/m.5944 type:complete len:313 (+) Transcript_4415:83-1021(+)|eukprot:CAMPEP_0196578968 /NCGR_PEP_ID=MMETSP1081-20130531/14384_1 /TAXON_ID=36882 /ORGANISM="Pyramimonas amylifera, Strain CCMP720" /LENGTH=312 /DNA_ID=CAMNT_0041898379 /DNA_START=83 /DNA_END=1021 /DNA_ORIENTATION=-
MISFVITCLAHISLGLVVLNYGGYFLTQGYVSLFRSQNLFKKYKAKWAVVTGASSGIGKSLAEKCASQGINVVLVALQEPLLDETFAHMQATFKDVQFRKVGVNLGRRDSGYLENIKDATKDIDVSLLFNNAGYIVTGFFNNTSVETQLANLECNACAAVALSHHFVGLMLSKGAKGAVVFTSSAAAMMPSPFAVMYGASKAFVSAFSASLAAEVKSRGIDVVAVHPSPVASRFYDKVHKLSAMDFFNAFSVKPEELPDAIFAAVGRCSLRDLGMVCIGFRLINKMMDANLLAWITANTAHTMDDFKKNLKE